MPYEDLDDLRIKKSMEISQSEYEFLQSHFPQIGNLIKFAGTTGEYYSKLAEQVSRPRHQHNKRILNVAEAIKFVGRDIYEKTVLSLISKALLEKPVLSTAEHHSPLTNLLNPAINQAYLRSLLNQDISITLSCSTVKLDDATQPRKLFYKDTAFSMLSNKHVKSIILKAPAFNIKDIDAFLQRPNLHEEVAATRVKSWWDNMMGNQFVYSHLWEQISHFNYFYWLDIFCKESKLELPSKYLMVPLEEVVRMCLINDLKTVAASWILDILSSSNLCHRLLLTLDGVDACWDTQRAKGSFLFWAIHNKKRVPLYLRNHSLYSECGTFNYPLSLPSLQQNLESQSIIPTASLSLIYLSLYSGIDLLGGPFQINYLSKIQEKISCEFRDIIKDEDYNTLLQTRTNFFVNFNKVHPAVTGGLYRLHSPITKDQLSCLFSQRFCDTTKGSIKRILSKHYRESDLQKCKQNKTAA